MRQPGRSRVYPTSRNRRPWTTAAGRCSVQTERRCLAMNRRTAVLCGASSSRPASSSSCVPAGHDDGKVILAIVIYRDVTEIRELEQAREDLVHSVSHDLRQPLAIIQGHAQI